MNIYYSPEKYGLTSVKDVEWRDEGYEFCLTALWKSQEGRFFVASDSGCSCPSPFEDYSSVDQLAEVKSLGDLLAHIKQASEDHYFNYDATTAQRAELVSAYQEARRA